MKKTVSTLLALSLCTLSYAKDTKQNDMQSRVDTLEQEMKEVSVQTAEDTFGAEFTSARPEVNGKGFFITFDVLYWHAKVGGTEYAYSFNPQISTGVFNIPTLLPARDGETKDNDFDWEWGLKAGLGFSPCYDGWDIYAQYTWFDSNTVDHSTKAPPAALAPLRAFENMIAEKAKSFFDLDYNNVDLEIGRNYFLSGFLSVRPFIGLKSSWIDLKQRSVYTASSLNDLIFHFPGDPLTNGLDFKVKENCKFWGMGPQIGVNSRWHLGSGFSIFGDLTGSILYGYFDTKHSEAWPPHLRNETDIVSGQFFKMKSKFHRFVPYGRMYGGLEWDRYINQNRQHLRLKLGYEVQYYWRVNQNFYIEDTTRSGFAAAPEHVRGQYEKVSEDVMFYGITGEVRLDF